MINITVKKFLCAKLLEVKLFSERKCLKLYAMTLSRGDMGNCIAFPNLKRRTLYHEEVAAAVKSKKNPLSPSSCTYRRRQA